MREAFASGLAPNLYYSSLIVASLGPFTRPAQRTAPVTPDSQLQDVKAVVVVAWRLRLCQCELPGRAKQ